MEMKQIVKYYRNNLPKFSAVAAGIALSVLLVYSFQMVIGSVSSTVNATELEPYKHFSIVRQKDMNPDEGLIEEIKRQPSVKAVLPNIYWTTDIQMLIGGVSSTDILQMHVYDIEIMLKQLKLKIIEGRMPVAGSFQLLMHEKAARNKGLKVGDQIGSYESKDEFIRGTYTIVGLVSGDAVISFAPMEAAMDLYNMSSEYAFGAVVLPKEGQLVEMNRYLEGLPNSYQTISYDFSKKFVDKLKQSVDFLVTGVSLMIMLICATFAGLLCYIYFYQRRNEFGLLTALGYTRQQVVNRSFAEIAGMCMTGFLSGILLSIAFGMLLNTVLFVPKGQQLQLVSADTLFMAGVIPVFATVFSVFPIWRMLKTLDPMMIVEGVE